MGAIMYDIGLARIILQRLTEKMSKLQLYTGEFRVYESSNTYFEFDFESFYPIPKYNELNQNHDTTSIL